MGEMMIAKMIIAGFKISLIMNILLGVSVLKKGIVMKKFLIIVFVISLTMNMLLGTCAVRQNLMYADIKINREENIIPDEETAIEIARMYVDANLGWEECREGESYCSGVFFDEFRNEWHVVFPRTSSSGMRILDSGYAVYIRRDNGMVTLLMRSLR